MRTSLAVFALALLATAGVYATDGINAETLEDFDSNAPQGESVSVFKSLLDLHIDPAIINFFNTTGTNGTVFVPTDAAITSFLSASKLTAEEFKANTAFVNAVLKDHVILPSLNDMSLMSDADAETEKMYTTFEGNTIKVMFNSSNAVTSVAPNATAPSTYAQMSTVLGHYGPIADASVAGNATVYFVDAVILTESTYTTFINKAASTYYDAIAKVNAEQDGILSTLQAVLDSGAFPDVTNLLKQDLDTGNDTTFFAPSNGAFAKLLSAVVADGTTAPSTEELVSTEGLKMLVGTILKYHYLPDVKLAQDPHSSFSNNDTADTLLTDDISFERATLQLSQLDGVNTITHGLDKKFTTNVTDNVKVITPTGFSLANSTSHQGHMHVIDDVLLPVEEATKFNLAEFNLEANGPSSVSTNYSVFEDLVAVKDSLLRRAQLAVNGPALRAAIFIPSDAAMTDVVNNFSGLTVANLLASPDLIRQIIYEHTLIDVVMDGTNKTYNTWAASGTGGDATVASKSLEITVDDNMWPKMIEANGETANVVDRYGPNANGFVADALNDGKKNGYVYYIDKALLSGNFTTKVEESASPANGQWSRSGAGITGESYATAEAVVKGIPEIDALFNNPEAKFLVFMPSDRAFETLAEELDISVSDLSSNLLDEDNAAALKKMMESYIVMESEYGNEDCRADDDCDMTVESWYETRAETFASKTSADGYAVSDDNPDARKLLAASTTGTFTCKRFFDGKRFCYSTSAPLTPDQEASIKEILNDSAAPAPASPCMIMLVALMATILALVGL